MSDEPFYVPNRATAPPRQSQPGERAWDVRLDHVAWSCEFRFHGESCGWQAQILPDGELFAGQRFVMREMAQAFAEAERQFLEKGGA